MFHAPTSESKQPGDPTHAQPSQERAQEVHPYSGAVPGRTAKRAAILQRGIGNQAMLRLLEQRARNPPAGQGAAGRSNPPPAQTRFTAPPGALQAKLVVGPANDPLEQEADRVAEQVMRMPDSEPAVTTSPPQISRQCAGCEEEEAKTLQTKPAATAEAAAGEAPAIVHEVLRSPGWPLDFAARAFIEPHFGYDFSRVRVHADAQAAESARAVNALAYTVGHDIIFGDGQYSPATTAGKRLLTHELTHVVQQNHDVAAHFVRPTALRQRSSHGQEATLQRQVQTPGEQSGGGTGGPTGGDPDKPLQCPHVPTGLGDKQPASPCPRATFAGTTELARWLFCLDSDQITTAGRLDDQLDKIVEDQPRSTRFLVQGHASIEGRADYNFRLACHRANRIFKALATALRRNLIAQAVVDEDRIQAEIQARIEVGTRGATTEFAGGLPANRVVVLYGEIPGGETPEKPDCKDAPRHLGDIKPEIGCDPPTVDLTGMNGGPHLRHFHFCLDSDVLAAVGPSDIATFAQSQAASATFVVHGFASTEGDAAYNQRLSCHRALRIARELINAGVRSEQIREVGGWGEINKFGDLEFNRVAIVLAEGGEISPLQDSKQPAKDREQKLAIRDAARARLLAGQYPLAADAYISFWTCGRTPTVAQAVERLTIEVPDNDEDERLADKANGIEEGLGVNAVQLSNTALHADNPIECTMGRLIDMAFHHAVIGDTDLSPDLLIDPPPRRGKPVRLTTPRHLAGLHLIALAGLAACSGKNAGAQDTAFGPVGIDEPLSDDPRAGIPPPGCARPPQPTSLLPPSKGEKERQRPDFAIFAKDFKLKSGNLSRAETAEKVKHDLPLSVRTTEDVIQASATVLLLGTPDVFADYEVGFMQTVVDDFTLAEYITGHQVLQKLPVPIRAAQMKGDVPVPQPWMALTAMAQPDAKGQVSLNAAWRMDTPFAPFLNFFRPGLFDHRTDFLDTWQRHTSLAFWLVARRRGSPLDRFSVLFIDGFVYDLTQNLNADFRRLKGDLEQAEESILGEKEFLSFVGQFRASTTSEEPADPHVAQFDIPVASDIDLIRQTTRILEPPPAPQGGGLSGGMGLLEYGQTIRQILDNLKVFENEKDPKQGINATDMPRLGFVFAPLEIHVDLDRRTGRIPPSFGATDEESPVRVKSNELGSDALHHLMRALSLRLSKRDFLEQGRSVIMNRQALDNLPGDEKTAEFIISLPPFIKDEPDLSQDNDVLKEMAEMWACSEITIKSPNFLFPKEFAKVYWMDRDGNIKRMPEQGYFVSSTEGDEKIQTFVECPLTQHPGGFALGTAHTHPMDDPDRALPSSGDKEMAKGGRCGRQHYIISEDRIVAYFSDGSQKDLGDRKSKLPPGVPCSQSIPGEVEEK